MIRTKQILALIVFAQFCCTSLWFAGNGVMEDLRNTFDLGLTALGHLTSSVQFGFIIGTLGFAFLSIADRFSPSKVFFYCALAGGLFNLGMVLEAQSFESLMLFRFLTGFSLAGIYPVGMKIASDYYKKGLGTSLGFLVGALVLGTAFPHLLKSFTGLEGLPWRLVIIITSGLSALGGILVMFLVPDGPLRKKMTRADHTAIFRAFKLPEFRKAAFGYFGHMWELYAFWAFIPMILEYYNRQHPQADLPVSLLTFLIIGTGGIACISGGYISRWWGIKRTATTALICSGICCLFSPAIFLWADMSGLLIFLFFWGFMVVADSPLFSTLVAHSAPPEIRATCLTIVNSIGFAITVISIQFLNILASGIGRYYLLIFLAIGPAIGVFKLLKPDVEP